ncbi:hypothetical protein FA13DRAFT_489609 [Coprinellus micaceus]|uniref:Uncharacterized protein n=1 Tax=Coprinellus micaceus TaxID=71717 RepID=A0A4Y7SC62_COPMI|nr:hypothetical protein FA13DRAFT_489609 [Coprinellus micaceus]
MDLLLDSPPPLPSQHPNYRINSPIGGTYFPPSNTTKYNDNHSTCRYPGIKPHHTPTPSTSACNRMLRHFIPSLVGLCVDRSAIADRRQSSANPKLRRRWDPIGMHRFPGPKYLVLAWLGTLRGRVVTRPKI